MRQEKICETCNIISPIGENNICPKCNKRCQIVISVQDSNFIQKNNFSDNLIEHIKNLDSLNNDLLLEIGRHVKEKRKKEAICFHCGKKQEQHLPDVRCSTYSNSTNFKYIGELKLEKAFEASDILSSLYKCLKDI